MLQIAIGITNCDKFIGNCNNYYKLRQISIWFKEGIPGESGDSAVPVISRCS